MATLTVGGVINSGSSGTSITTLSYTYPSAPKVGSLLLAMGCINGTSMTLSAPTGYSLIGTSTFASNTRTTYLWARVADGTEGSSITTNVTGGTATGLWLYVVDVVGYKMGQVVGLDAATATCQANYGTLSTASTTLVDAVGAGGSAGSTYWDPTPSPSAVISFIGANGSMSSNIGINTGRTPWSLAALLASSSAVGSTGIAVAVQRPYLFGYTNNNAGVQPGYILTAGRAMGIVSVLLTPQTASLSAVGVG